MSLRQPTFQQLPSNFFQNPHEFYSDLAAHGELHPIELDSGMKAWLVTGYEMARRVLRDPTVCKDAHSTAGTAARSGGRRTGATTVSAGITAHMLNSDPPRHTRLRRLVSHAFTPARIEKLRPRVEEITDRLLTDMTALGEGGPVDLMERFAVPLPITVISELLGVPTADRHRFRRWTNDVIDVVANDPGAVRAASLELQDYLHDLITDRAAGSPRDDLISALITAGNRDDRLTEQELISTVFLILVAGYETTVNLIGNAALAVLTGCASSDAAVDDAERLIEETLRHDGPVNIATLRYTTVPLELDGYLVEPGSLILVALAAANRDPQQFHQPDAFNLDNEMQAHLAFGGGIHHCLGSGLARMEGTIAIRALFTRYPTLALTPVDLMWKPSILIRGLESLPVTLPR